MAMRYSLLLAGSALADVPTIAKSGNSALDAVVELLHKMHKENNAAIQEEETNFAAFSKWCTDTTGRYTRKTEKQKQDIEQLGAEKNAADSLAKEADELANGFGQDTQRKKEQLKKTHEERKEAHDAYMTDATDLHDSVFAVNQAKIVLRENVGGAATAFLQLKRVASKVAGTNGNGSQRRRASDLMALVQQLDNPYQREGEEPDLIIQMLDKLSGDLESQLQAAHNTEQGKKAAYDSFRAATIQEIENLKKRIDEEEKTRAEQMKTSGDKAAEAEELTRIWNADTQYLEHTETDCGSATNEYNTRLDVRNAEVAAISEAIQILSGEEVQQGTQRLNEAQTVGDRAVKEFFLQLPSPTSSTDAYKVVSFLRSKGKQLKSKALLSLAEVAESEGGPFDKIVGLIKELVGRLEEQARVEGGKHKECTESMEANSKAITECQQSTDTQSSTLELQTAKAEEQGALAAELDEDIQTMTTDLHARREEREKDAEHNSNVITESNKAARELERAIDVLKGHYGESSLIQVVAATAQTPADAAHASQDAAEIRPTIQRGEYKGSGDGPLALLGSILQQTVALSEQTQNLEDESAKNWTDSSRATEITLEKNGMSLHAAQVAEADAKVAMAGAEEQLKQLNEEMKGLTGLKAILDKKCTAEGSAVSFDDRDAARKAEIISLNEALEILKGMQEMQ